ncbi:MAG: ABC transporter ATP-binding protein [Epsilonproteobacteria bacterium]|nr:ABC transporter ATP-binding protein [Campylobacterota bacterium]
MEAIKIENIHKTFRSLKKKQKAVEGVSFCVDTGEIFGFLGPNGAGKSTTIKIIMDLIKTDEGKVLINGIDSTDYRARRNLGFLPENPSFVENLTGMETLMFQASMHNIQKREAADRADKLINLFELSDSADKQIRKYSKGMIQRLGIIAAIIHKPNIIILDEPMSGLDPIGRYLFKKTIKRLNKEGATIFFSSHIISDIEDLCSNVVILNKGKIIKTISKDEMKYLSSAGYKIIFEGDAESAAKAGKLSNINGVENLGETLYAITIKEAALFASVLEKLKELDLKIISIKPIGRDLESIFIKLMRSEK